MRLPNIADWGKTRALQGRLLETEEMKKWGQRLIIDIAGGI